MGEETMVMLCIAKKLLKEKPDLAIYPGSTEASCHDCGQVVFISPATQIAMRKHNVILVCPECYIKRLQSEKGQVEFHVLPGTAREVRLWEERRH